MTLNLNDLYAKVSANFWKSEQVAGWVKAHFYDRTSFVASSSGTQHANLPVKTGSDGKIDDSLIDEDLNLESITLSEADATVYVPTDATHTAYINLENTSATTGASSGIGFRVDAAGGATLQRAFFGVVSIAASFGPAFVWKLRTGASTYLEVLRIALDGLATFAGTVSVGGFIRVPSASKTIASGSITATCTHTVVDTEGAAAADDLVTINGGTAGDIIILRSTSAARVVTVKDATGNINLGADRVLNSAHDVLMLFYNGTFWCEIAFGNNA
jgi:hypothetical protein